MDTPLTLRDLAARLRMRGSAPALIAPSEDKVEIRDFSTVADEIERLASGLVSAGIEAGDPIGIYADGNPDWIIAFLAIVTAGAVAVPFDVALKGSFLAQQVDDSGCRCFFVGVRQAAALQEIDAVDGTALYLLGEECCAEELAVTPWRKLMATTVSVLPALLTSNQATLFYTSGTTGKPKGVPLTHANLIANINSLVAEHMVGPGDRVLLPLPPHHVYPLVVGALSPLAAGAGIVFPAGLSGPQLVDALDRGKASVLIGVPRLYAALIEAIEARINNLGSVTKASIKTLLRLMRLVPDSARRSVGRLVFRQLRSAIGPHLRLLASGGASLNPNIWRALERYGWTVLTGYGLTETAPILTFNPLLQSKIGSTGKPLKDVELRIVHGGDNGIGEIEARGPNVFGGYRDRPEETAAAFTPDGWFRTGDLGYLDDDGYLFVVGRVKELIVLPDGKNIFAETIEAIYDTSPLIREIAVLEEDGNLVGLVVPDLDELRKYGAESAVQLIHDAIRDISPTLPPHQRLSGYELTRTTLPRTAIGKLKRHQLPALYRNVHEGAAASPEDLTAEDRAFLSESRAAEIWKWLNQRFPERPLSLDVSPQLDLGIDSLGWTGLSLEIEDRFGASLSEEQIARIVTLRDFVCEVKAGSATPVSISDISPQDTRYLAPPRLSQRLLNIALYGFFWLAMRLFFRLRVTGLQNLPTADPFIIAPNHASWLDPIAIAASLPYKQARRTRFAGWTGMMFDSIVSRAISWAARVFPVDPDRAAARGVSLARAVLNQGDILVWFPEGRRTRTGSLLPFQPGIGALLEGTQISVVPAYIDGSYEAAPTGRLLARLARIRVRFGAPQTAEALMKTRSDDLTPQHISDALQSAVTTLQDMTVGNRKPDTAD